MGSHGHFSRTCSIHGNLFIGKCKRPALYVDTVFISILSMISSTLATNFRNQCSFHLSTHGYTKNGNHSPGTRASILAYNADTLLAIFRRPYCSMTCPKGGQPPYTRHQHLYNCLSNSETSSSLTLLFNATI